jgi:DNA-binding CsgD family transcriptional regulator
VLDRVAPISLRRGWRVRLMGRRWRRLPAWPVRHVLARPSELFAGGAAATALPLLVFALDLPTWLAIALAVATYVGLILVWPPVQRRSDATRADVEEHAGPAEAVPTAVLAEVAPTPGVIALADTSANGDVRLTPREHDVLRLLNEGLSNREIADRLSISPRTVPHHTGSLFDKLGVTSRMAAIAAARRRGLL